MSRLNNLSSKNLFMKKLLFLPLLMLFFNSYAQTPVNKSMAIVQKCTATWCGPCGSWGWTLQEDITTDNMSGSNPNGFVFALYGSSSSNYYNAAAGQLTTWAQSFPNWAVNNINRTAFSSTGGIYPTTTQTTIKSAVDSFAAIAPNASTGFTVDITGNNITINTKTKFWKSVSGTYNVGVYIIEDSVYGTQNGQTGSVYHHNVLRGNMGSTVFGDQIATGSISANQTFDKTFTYTITDNTWNKSRLKFLTVIWKKNGTSWDFENANNFKSYPTGIATVEAVDQLTVYPNPATNDLHIMGALTKQAATQINLINAIGQVVYTKDLPFINEQLNEHINIDNLSNGLYLLLIKSDNALTSEKVIIRK